ncbi:Metallo-hydrolase/oxidoreductase [Jaminaea rosea]|uniref:Metallo-hydrolase/oxidoreductase n=1 Tax=Jaminaea rosea TaxID=1569628 RepID=A0A316UI99_9BASI|nr:Metallo-hydrolase/oxidoreductase [Jaminaea rosea]PWN25067.1 Metallo-hydrolase/oxidoreductase [Jaminaea rosea]
MSTPLVTVPLRALARASRPSSRQILTASTRASSSRVAPTPAPTLARLSPRFEAIRTLATTTSSPTTQVTPFYHQATGSWTYVVTDVETRQAVVIDPVLDLDVSTGKVDSAPLQPVVDHLRNTNARCTRILETHVHADHLTGSRVLREMLLGAGGDVANIPIGIGAGVRKVQETIAPKYGINLDEVRAAFDEYHEPGSAIPLGNSQIRVHHMPGHTSDHLGYQVNQDIFTGDVILMPDIGTARTDFPGGASLDLAATLEKLIGLPRSTRIHVGHDYPPQGREARSCMTLEEQMENVHIQALKKGTFVQEREKRNKALGAPRLIHPSLQFNVAGGRLLRDHFVFPAVSTGEVAKAAFPKH